MSGDSSYCLSCTVYNENREEFIKVLQLAVERRNVPLIEYILHPRYDLSINAEIECKFIETFRRYGFEVSPEDAKDCSFFHTAVRIGCLTIVEYLLNFGTNFNIGHTSANTYNVTPLHTAVKFKQIEIVRLLIKNEADVNAKTSYGQTPLHYTLEMNEENDVCIRDIAKILLDSGARVDEPDEHRITALQIAVEKGYEKVVELLCEHKADVNQVDRFKTTPLMDALREKHVEIVRLLIKHNADVNAKDECGETPLLYALKCDMNDTSIRDLAKIILESGARVNEHAKDGTTALHVAVNRGYEKVVELLFEHKADVNQAGELKRTPLMNAMQRKSIEIVRLLIKHNADVNAKDECGETPLIHALKFGMNDTLKRDFAKILLDNGARVNEHAKDGTTALHVAADRRCQKVVELLFEHEADVNSVDKDNETPLHLSARNGNESIAKIFLDKGAKINAERTDKSTAICIAVEKENENIVKLLMENGADITYRNRPSSTLLHLAATDDNSEILEILLNGIDDVDCRDEDGRTALYSAVISGSAESVCLLLDHGSDIDLLYNSGKTGVNGDSRRAEIERRHMLLRCDLEMETVFTQHIVKMMALGRRVNEDNLPAIFINNLDKCEDFRTQCKNEIECMKQKKIGVSNISYYDLLTMRMSRLAFYSRNKDIIDALETEDHKDMFQVYSAMIHSRFKNGQWRVTLLEPSSKSLSDLTGYPLPDSTINALSDYLSNGDLKNLIEAGPCNENDNQHSASQTRTQPESDDCDLESTE